MNKKLELKIKSDVEFQDIIKEIVNNNIVQRMKKFKQHCDTNCFEHCYIASYYCYVIAKSMNLDYKSMARGAILHDLFLYDWRNSCNKNYCHALEHPRVAYENASKLFNLNKKEKDIILKHMWPMTIIPPKTLESFILICVDKYCAITEICSYYLKNLFVKLSFLR